MVDEMVDSIVVGPGPANVGQDGTNAHAARGWDRRSRYHVAPPRSSPHSSPCSSPRSSPRPGHPMRTPHHVDVRRAQLPWASMADPLPPDRIEIRAVQFVGTNVEMTYLVDVPEDEAEPRLDALLGSKLGLYALTPTGLEDGRARFSVIASPLDRLFHKIGPSTALTVIKHASVTLDLSVVNLERQGHGLMRTNPGPEREGDVELWPAWDAGKLLGTLLCRPALHDHGEVRVAEVPVQRGTFPHVVLPVVGHDVAEHGGVRTVLPPGLRAALTG